METLAFLNGHKLGKKCTGMNQCVNDCVFVNKMTWQTSTS